MPIQQLLAEHEGLLIDRGNIAELPSDAIIGDIYKVGEVFYEYRKASEDAEPIWEPLSGGTSSDDIVVAVPDYDAYAHNVENGLNLFNPTTAPTEYTVEYDGYIAIFATATSTGQGSLSLIINGGLVDTNRFSETNTASLANVSRVSMGNHIEVQADGQVTNSSINAFKIPFKFISSKGITENVIDGIYERLSAIESGDTTPGNEADPVFSQWHDNTFDAELTSKLSGFLTEDEVKQIIDDMTASLLINGTTLSDGERTAVIEEITARISEVNSVTAEQVQQMINSTLAGITPSLTAEQVQVIVDESLNSVTKFATIDYTKMQILTPDGFFPSGTFDSTRILLGSNYTIPEDGFIIINVRYVSTQVPNGYFKLYINTDPTIGDNRYLNVWSGGLESTRTHFNTSIFPVDKDDVICVAVDIGAVGSTVTAQVSGLYLFPQKMSTTANPTYQDLSLFTTRPELLESIESSKEVTYTQDTTMYQSDIDIAHVQAPNGDMALTPMTESIAHAQNDYGYWQIVQELRNIIQANQALITEQNHQIQLLKQRVATLEDEPYIPEPEYNMNLPVVLKTPPLIGVLGIEIPTLDLITSDGYTILLDGLIVIDGAAAIGLLTPTWIARNGEKLDPDNPLAVLSIIGGGASGSFPVKVGDIITEQGMGNVTFYPEI